MNLGAVQLIPTATTCSQESAMEAHSSIGSPFTKFAPSLQEKENQAGMLMPSSSRSSAYAYHTKQVATTLKRNIVPKIQIFSGAIFDSRITIYHDLHNTRLVPKYRHILSMINNCNTYYRQMLYY